MPSSEPIAPQMHDAGTVFEKTELGREAVANRNAALHPRLRTLLILIDGRKTFKQLMEALLGLTMPLAGTPAITTLLAGGYIRAVKPGKPTGAGLVPPIQGPVTRAGPLSREAAADYAQKLSRGKEYVLGYMTRYLGRDTHTVLGALLEAKSHSQFISELQLCHQILVDVASAEEANIMIANCKALFKS